MNKMNPDQLYNLLNDIHNALAKSELDGDKYHDLSIRLVKAKQEILNHGKKKIYSDYNLLGKAKQFYKEREWIVEQKGATDYERGILVGIDRIVRLIERAENSTNENSTAEKTYSRSEVIRILDDALNDIGSGLGIELETYPDGTIKSIDASEWIKKNIK